jgi:hypothetical protein
MTDSRKLKRYSLNPPLHKWLFRSGNDTIFADVFPQVPNQPEDQLNETNVKEGYCYVSALRVWLINQNETPSGIDIIQESLTSSLGRLSSLGQDILNTQSNLYIPS